MAYKNNWNKNVNYCTIHRYFYEVLSAIDSILKNIRFPLHDEEGLNELEEGLIVALLTFNISCILGFFNVSGQVLF